MLIPRFSIVIPTRERARTLYHTLRTCIMQNHDNFEIVVCDNCSSPETKQVVDSLECGKIKYVRSDILLAMSDNWELALSHAVGEYVIVIGDDDGMLPNALTDLDLFITRTQAKAIRWAVVTYLWPDVQAGLAANKIHVPVPAQTILIDSHQAIKSVIKGQRDYSYLPMLYYSAIHRDLIQELKNRTGKIFKGSNPDVYSSFAIGYIAKTHYMIGKPISIVGYSGKSNGVAYMNVKNNASIMQDFHRLNESAGYSFDPQIPNISAMAAVVANEFVHAKRALFPGEDQFVLDRKQLIVNCIKDLENFNRVEKQEWDIFMQIIEASLSDDKKLQRWFRRTFMEKYRPRGRPWIFSQAAWEDGLTTGSLYLDGKELGISDVLGAAEFGGKLIGRSTHFTNVVDELDLKGISNLDLNFVDKEQAITAFRTSLRFWLVNGPLNRFRLFQFAVRIAKRFKSVLFSRSSFNSQKNL